MAFKEEGTVEYITVDGKEVPVVKCEAEIVLIQKQITNIILTKKQKTILQIQKQTQLEKM